MKQRLLFSGKALYSLLRTIVRLVAGIWRISAIPKPFVSIFGGARLGQDDQYAQLAHTLAQQIVDEDISVLTGGGPGIMEAANCGAIYTKHGNGRSIGIGVRDLNEAINVCVQEYFLLDEFWARKWLLTRYSSIFIVFPGGFGTLDEFCGVITLIQTKKIPVLPIILVGSEYWKPFMQWIIDKPYYHGLINHCEMELLSITDDITNIIHRIKKVCASQKASS
jgi:uncharacterized protein (TIGR00730 family)